jgi:hypothetical protein
VYIKEACLALDGPLGPLPITAAANGRKTFQPSSVNVTQTAAAAKEKNQVQPGKQGRVVAVMLLTITVNVAKLEDSHSE